MSMFGLPGSLVVDVSSKHIQEGQRGHSRKCAISLAVTEAIRHLGLGGIPQVTISLRSRVHISIISASKRFYFEPENQVMMTDWVNNWDSGKTAEPISFVMQFKKLTWEPLRRY